MDEYMMNSLEQHLFFGRIMKEHALFLKAGFLPPNGDLARESEGLMRAFEGLLSRAIGLSNRVVRRCVLDSGELFTPFTDCAERQTQRLTGIPIERTLTDRVMELTGSCGGALCVSRDLERQVRQLNREGLRLVDRLIDLKERTLRGADGCTLFTANYPLLIEHILREARHYRGHLARLEGMDCCSCRELREEELFWDQIMMEHALFMRGLLDPTEEELIRTADGFAGDYRKLLAASAAANEKCMGDQNPLELTRKFRDFKRSGVEGIEACKIRALILPLLADHVLREANHYIRLLEE